jgi:hypothetical protein
MPLEKFEDAEAIDNKRRKAIAKSIRIISIEELKKLGEEMFDDPDRPWRQTFLSLIAENLGATFYHANITEPPRFVQRILLRNIFGVKRIDLFISLPRFHR